MASTYVGVAESSVPTARLDAESVVFGTTTVFRERVQLAGDTSGAVVPVTSDAGLLVEISSLSTLHLTTESAVRVKSTGTLTVTGTSNIAGNTTAIISTVSAIRVKSTATLTVTGTSNIAGNTTAIISTVSAIRVKSTATLTVTGTSNIAGNTTAIISTASKIISDLSTGTTGRVEISAAVPQSSVTIQGGQSTAILTTASITRVEPVSSGTMAVNSRIQSSQVLAGTTLVAVQYTQFTFATTGGQTIVSSAANAVIRVLGMNLVCASTTVLTWFSDTTGGTTISGPQSFAANGGIVLPTNPHGWFQTTAGAPLTVKSEAASSVGGSVTFIQSTALA